METVRKIENVKAGADNKPEEAVIITDCGAEKVEEPFAVEKKDSTE